MTRINEFTDRAGARREDRRLLTGAGSFVADLRVPGMAHAAMVRSPYAHAQVARIDTQAARAMPGVIAVLTGAELAADGVADLPCGVEQKRPDGSGAPQTTRPTIARERVRYAGEIVAVVVAESAAAASDAAERVDVAYRELPAIALREDALAPGAPGLWPGASDNVAFLWSQGDAAAVAAAMARAEHVTRLGFDISRVAPAPIEPRGSIGSVAADGRLVLQTANQSPHALRAELARIFALPPERLRVVAGDVGGGFGMKASTHPEDVIVLWAARRLGRAVRWISERGEAFLSDAAARDLHVEAQLALDREGNFLALDVGYDANIGAYLSGRSLVMTHNAGGIAGVYRTPAIACRLRGVFTNTVPTAAYRGAGRPEATFTIERIIDVAARELGVDPIELRRRNLIAPEAMPFKTGLTFTYDCGEFAANMDEAARLADLDGFPARRAAAKARGRLRGLGLCNPIEVAGGPFLRPGKDLARLEIAADGSAVLTSGSMSVGQGHETVFPALVAERLGIAAERIAYRRGDTDLVEAGRGSGGSSGLCVGGTTVAVVTGRLIEKARQLAADQLEAAPQDLEFAAGRFTVAGTDRAVTLGEIAARVGGLAEAGEFQPAKVTFPNGCHICEVEIDPETGKVEMIGYWCVEDAGRVINRALLEGQIHGGVAQGVGQILHERIVHDRATGQLLAGSFMDYQMPRASDFPSLDVATREVPTQVNPLGAKGVGEAGTVGSMAAALNAVCDALAPLGIVHVDMPATPARIWEAIRRSQARP